MTTPTYPASIAYIPKPPFAGKHDPIPEVARYLRKHFAFRFSGQPMNEHEAWCEASYILRMAGLEQ